MGSRMLVAATACAAVLSLGSAGPIAAEQPAVPTIERCGVRDVSVSRALHFTFGTRCLTRAEEPLPAGYTAKVVFTDLESGETVEVPLEKTILRYQQDVVVPAGNWIAALWLTTPEGTFREGVDAPGLTAYPRRVAELDPLKRPTMSVGGAGFYRAYVRGGTNYAILRFTAPVTGVSASTVKVYGPSGAQIPANVTYDPTLWDAKVTLRNGLRFTAGREYRFTASTGIFSTTGRKLVKYDRKITAH